MRFKIYVFLAFFSVSLSHAAEFIEGQTSCSRFSAGKTANTFPEWSLSNYRKSTGTQGIDLRFVTGSPEGHAVLAFDTENFKYLTAVVGNIREVSTGNFEWSFEDQAVKITKTFSFANDRPYVDMGIQAEFKGDAPKRAFLYIDGNNPEADLEHRDRMLTYYSDSKLHSFSYESKDNAEESPVSVDWIAATSRYFVFALIPKDQKPTALIQRSHNFTGRVSLVYNIVDKKLSTTVRAFAGPKDLTLLRSVEPKLDQALDLGFFSIVAYPLLRLLKWFYSFTHNYGFAIILLTLLVRLFMFPLMVKSMKSMKTMAKLQPEIQRLKERYKDDKQAQNLAMMNFLKTNKYNPMAGCLPILVQIPVFFALYKVLYSAVELYQAPFALWIHDLSAKDPFYVTPVLLSLVMFMQQKLSPQTSTDPVQQKMMLYMPLVFGLFMLTLPSGLTLYMLVSGVFGVIQQLIINRQTERNA